MNQLHQGNVYVKVTTHKHMGIKFNKVISETILNRLYIPIELYTGNFYVNVTHEHGYMLSNLKLYWISAAQESNVYCMWMLHMNMWYRESSYLKLWLNELTTGNVFYVNVTHEHGYIIKLESIV
jgi:hypothetical protein